ncbi:MAG: efflux RND transporter periplasmic adaptor subunit [Acidobacteria bacterium]|nr:efflux RND transporter periplasmic adaptor subunit [Acidobacteriota bacterium]
MAVKSSRIWLATLAALAVLVGWTWRRSSERAVIEVRTAKVSKQDIHSGVITSGQAEPVAFRELRTEISGLLRRLHVNIGDRVRAGSPIADLSAPELQSELAQASAELATAAEQKRVWERGGTPAQLLELQTQINLAKKSRDQSESLVQQNERLAEKGAIAKLELEQARQRLTRANDDLELLEGKWRLRSDADALKHIDAQLEAAEAARNLANSRLRAASVLSPMEGIVYSLPFRVGDHAGSHEVIARVGDTRQMRVRIFVDEPDLGRVALGQDVQLQWDGLPGKLWTGKVEQIAFSVEKRADRTGGEVVASVENPSGELLPNTNLTVEIITEGKQAVLTIPREALEGDGDHRSVYVLRGDQVEMRSVVIGLMNTTRAEVIDGLNEGEEVALLADRVLRNGMRARRTGP